MIYVPLPIWQADFALSYGALAMLRGVYAGTMASLQLAAGRSAHRLGSRATLALGTLLAAAGYAAAGTSGGLSGLCVALALSGTGLRWRLRCGRVCDPVSRAGRRTWGGASS